MKPYTRERVSAEVTLTPDTVASYAAVVRDTNPLHHDPHFAAATRFGRMIASGTQTVALLLGLTASHYSKIGTMVGLELWVHFRRPVYANETIRLERLCVRVTRSDTLRGDVGARGKVLVAEHL